MTKLELKGLRALATDWRSEAMAEDHDLVDHPDLTDLEKSAHNAKIQTLHRCADMLWTLLEDSDA